MNNQLIINSDDIRKVTIENLDCKFINYKSDSNHSEWTMKRK